MKTPLLLASALPLLLVAPVALAQSRSTFVANAGGNPSVTEGRFAYNSSFSPDASPVSISGSKAFTGLDSGGAVQTMNFMGAASGQASYGRLRTSVSGSLSNTYSNPDNPVYWDGTTENDEGSPEELRSLAFASFTDILQFGGTARAGYGSQYVFQVDGMVTGTNIEAFLNAFIADDAVDSFTIDTSPGRVSQFYRTRLHTVTMAGQTARVSFTNQFRVDLTQEAEGATLTGSGDFLSTITLVAVEVYDEQGNFVPGATATGASGTVYPTSLNPVPEPATMAALGLGAAALLRRRRR